jgi:hypothetical protein
MIAPLISFGHCDEEEQTTQWPEEIKGAIRIRISKKNKQHNGQKISKGQS